MTAIILWCFCFLLFAVGMIATVCGIVIEIRATYKLGHVVVPWNMVGLLGLLTFLLLLLFSTLL
jgi:hypothetical protein